MQIPHKVRIKGKVSYEVVWVDKFDDADVYGLCDYDKKIIYIKKKMSAMESRRTFWHELTHAMEFEYGFQIPHSVVHEMEKAQEAVFRLNKWRF